MGIALLDWELLELLKSSDLVSCRTSVDVLALSALLLCPRHTQFMVYHLDFTVHKNWPGLAVFT